MADEIKNARKALHDVLQEIPGLSVYDHPPSGGAWDYPAFIMLSPIQDPPLALGGSSFRATFNSKLLINSQLDAEAFEILDTFMEPLGSHSIKAVIGADPTLNGAVDWCGLVQINRSGWRAWNDANFVMADFRIDMVKQVLT